MRQRQLAGTGFRRMRGKRMLFGSTHARKQGRYEKGKHSSSLGSGIAGISRCRGRHWLSTRTKGCCFRRAGYGSKGRPRRRASSGGARAGGGAKTATRVPRGQLACLLACLSVCLPIPRLGLDLFSTNPHFRLAIDAIHSLWRPGTRLLLRQAHDSDITHLRTRLSLLDRTGPGDGVWFWEFVFLAFAVQVKVFRAFGDRLASVRWQGIGRWFGGFRLGFGLSWIG
jgi:hypothetical protein